MGEAFNSAMQQVGGVVVRITQDAENLAGAAAELSSVSSRMTDDAEHAAASTQAAATQLADMAAELRGLVKEFTVEAGAR